MTTTTAIFLALISLLSHLLVLTAQPDFFFHKCFNESGNYTKPSAYHTNLNTLLSNFTSDTKIDYGFYNYSNGETPNRVNALGMCRGDVKPDSCRSCLNNAITLLPNLCPYQKEAFGYYDLCMFRYASRQMFGIYQDHDFQNYSGNQTDAVDANKYKDSAIKLLHSLKERAKVGEGSYHKVAAGNATADQSQAAYGLVQCTPDLNEQDCFDCLTDSIFYIPNCCQDKVGGRVIKLNCNIRFENFLFFDPAHINSVQLPLSPADLSPPTDSTSSQGGSKKSRTTVIAVVLIGTLVAVLILFFIIKRSKKTHGIEAVRKDDDEMKPTDQMLQIDLNTIKLATDNFSDANKLGKGGFGPVYKGRLPDGQEVAVKMLSKHSSQGDLEFKTEVMLLAKLHHRNLVRLLGFCLEKTEKLLIYELLPNKSLDFFLFDPNQQAYLNWIERFKIIRGIARGLLYLHQDSRLRIIHRDLKASNILLDEELNPKISDFGTARLFKVDQTRSNTNRIVGTFGYMAPEYVLYGQCSVKSDVYSFGILVLEIISGKKNNSTFHADSTESLDLLNFGWKNWREGTASSIVDPVLRNGTRNEIMRCIHIALLCVQENAADRPTMASVSFMLNSFSSSLPLPSERRFLVNYSSSSQTMALRHESSETTRSSDEHGSNSNQPSRNDLSITELYPR
ncbi:hypothetical protein QN277_001265 [Acacia crassicarpa]|uniref:Cysteine-rich receptor-like protein kinase n=1 Tax=Acacia crassicarpa TaxID=499986 RepID=A0AAE1TGL6_9FABA|nr:hypothetical protein QN277_001265 [Acacia crassicarpa]